MGVAAPAATRRVAGSTPRPRSSHLPHNPGQARLWSLARLTEAAREQLFGSRTPVVAHCDVVTHTTRSAAHPRRRRLCRHPHRRLLLRHSRCHFLHHPRRRLLCCHPRRRLLCRATRLLLLEERRGRAAAPPSFVSADRLKGDAVLALVGPAGRWADGIGPGMLREQLQTAYGDAVGRSGRDRFSAPAQGAAKASVGHAEAASGQIGLLKAHSMVRGMASAGNAQLRALNPVVAARLVGTLLYVRPTLSAPAALPRPRHLPPTCPPLRQNLCALKAVRHGAALPPPAASLGHSLHSLCLPAVHLYTQ